MNDISQLTREIAEEYTALSGMRIQTPADYLLFRNQALKEQNTEKRIPEKSGIPLQPVAKVPDKKTSVPAQKAQETPRQEPAQKADNKEHKGNFFECLSRLED